MLSVVHLITQTPFLSGVQPLLFPNSQSKAKAKDVQYTFVLLHISHILYSVDTE